jgi:hypothetical protein
MSSITNVITTVFRARGNQAIATMGSIGAGFGNIGRQINQTSRMSERLNNQWRAIGTTFRYALAGTAVFGTAQLIKNLGDLQRQVGLIQALGGAQGGILPNTKFPVTGLMADARKEAVRSLTPINQFNEGLINMFSTVQNVPENQAAKMMGEISLAAQLAQTDSETASKAIFGMFSTFGMAPNMVNVQKMTRSLTELITEVPGGPEAARQIFQQFPQLASIAQMGRGTLPQIIGLYETNLRTGGTAGTTGRGLQYLMQTVAFPERQTKTSRRALASVGITPEYVEKYGVTRALLRLITAIRTKGGVNVKKGSENITDDELEAMAGELPTDVLQLGNAGITGPGGRLLAAAIPRIHGARSLALLASRPEILLQDLEDIQAAWDGNDAALKEYADKIKAFTDPQKLNAAAIAVQAAQQQVILAFQPIANLAARGIVGAEAVTERHPEATKRVILGSGAFLAALGIGKFFGVPGVRKLPGIRNLLGNAYVQEEAARAATGAGGQRSGQSPQDALFVIVVGEIFGSSGGGGGGGGGKGGKGPGVDDAAEAYLGYRGLRTVGKWGRKGLSRVGNAIDDIGRTASIKLGGAGADKSILTKIGTKVGLKGIPVVGSAISFFADAENVNQGEGEWLARRNRAREVFGKTLASGQSIVNVPGQARLGQFQGKAHVFMRLEIHDKNTGKNRLVQVHVPVSMWEHGRAPSSQGKAGNKRK